MTTTFPVSYYRRKSDNRWVGKIYYGVKPSGEQDLKYVYGLTKKEAAGKAAKAMAERLAVGDLIGSKQTLGEFTDAWIKAKREQSEHEWKNVPQEEWRGLRRKTLMQYEGIIKNHVMPCEVAKVPLRKLTRKVLNDHYQWMIKNGRSYSTAHLTHRVLHVIVECAVNKEVIGHNVASGAWHDLEAKKTKKKKTMWTAEETQLFLNEAKMNRLYCLYLLKVVTGMRIGELLGLQWKHIDFVKGEITVQQQLEEAEGMRLGPLKTINAYRLVSIDPDTIRELKAHKARMAIEGASAKRCKPWDVTDESLVFCNTFGGFISQGNLADRSFNKIIAAAGIPRMTIHALRHLHATLCDTAGVTLKAASARLGHSDVRLTQNLYTHGTKEADRQAALLVGKSIFGEQPAKQSRPN